MTTVRCGNADDHGAHMFKNEYGFYRPCRGNRNIITEVRECRTEGCERTARDHSPYCNACFSATLDAAYAPAFWPTDAEINDMAREREGNKS